MLEILTKTNALMRFFRNRINAVFFLLSLALGLNSLLFLASMGEIYKFAGNNIGRDIFYLVYFGIIVLAFGYYFWHTEKAGGLGITGKTLLLFLPTEIIYVYGSENAAKLSPLIGMAGALYILLAAIYLSARVISSEKKIRTAKQTEKSDRKQEVATIAIVLAVMLLNLGFSTYRLGKLAAVDEPLWTFDRIPNFWRDFGEKDWRGARVSDKPGLPVAVISGIGLLSEDDPKKYKDIVRIGDNNNVYAAEMESFNFAFRFPIVLFVTLMLPLFYVFAKNLVGRKNALLGFIFVGLSPILIGNSRIINPDSILWIFTSLSLLAYFTYLKDEKKSHLLLSALFLGLGILTKYTANILYLFFFIMIFADYVLTSSARPTAGSFYRYLRKRLADYALLVIISLAVFYVFYPAVWGKPDRLLLGTIRSQAFAPVWPLFAGMIGFVLADLLILKSFLVGAIMKFFARFRKQLFWIILCIFFLSILGVFLNVYGNMGYYDFEGILSSPKSSFGGNDTLGFFLANFYPLVFGISAIALFVVFAYFALLSRKKLPQNEASLAILYLIIFILAYYLGSVASKVASIIRYQIIIFPAALMAAGIALGEILKNFYWKDEDAPETGQIKKHLPCFALILLLLPSLLLVKPFYMGYASVLLPQKYYLDVKDMGEGSYEAAAYLNSLPDAKDLVVWSDKQGVCVFFVGRCHTSISTPLFSGTKMDYFVLSSGRKNRTIKMSSSPQMLEHVDFRKLYATHPPTHVIEMAGRPGNYVKIVTPSPIK